MFFLYFILLIYCFHFLGDRRCGHPAVPPNARVSLSVNTDIVPGTVATYECDDGYELFGPHQRECTLRGDWTAEPPFCGTKHFSNAKLIIKLIIIILLIKIYH